MTHGTRRTYARGCRCRPCRVANAAYSSAHRTPSGIVSATRARGHLRHLAQQGIGARQVTALTGVATSVVSSVRSGRTKTLRPSTAARLLAAPPTHAPGALVSAYWTWRTVDGLERELYTRREIAFLLGAHSQQLQLGAHLVRSSSALKLSKLHTRLLDQ